MHTHLLLSLLLLLHHLPVTTAISEPTLASDRTTLLTFLSQVPHSRRLRWPLSIPTCSWTGISCSAGNLSVTSLRLPGCGLVGPLPPLHLPNLTTLSLRSNWLSGPLPDLSPLPSLRLLFLQKNRFSSHLPHSLPLLLSRLDLSSNNLSGPIPSSLNGLSRLSALLLGGNNLSGPLPDLPSLRRLRYFSVAQNRLSGPIPSSLDHFPLSSFLGNPDLCGRPLPPCSSSAPPPPSQRRRRRIPVAVIIAVSVAGGIACLLVIFALFWCRRGVRSSSGGGSKPSAARSPSGATGTTSSIGPDGARNRLVIVEGAGVGFDLEDLLRASAEVLGKGSLGTSYKAVLEDGVTTVVVKRLRDVTASKREFDLQMELVGKAKHPNLAPLRAYYYSRDERLLVTEHFPGGSLSASLHGTRALDWLTRLRVALAAARGLAHLHLEAKMVHGNIKASNVLLRLDPVASVITDYGLVPLFSGAAVAPPHREAGYRAPEVVETRRHTFESDVYSYGVVVLEILTRRAPQYAAVGEEAVDLPRWVQSVVREEWTAEVFDAQMLGYGSGEAAEEEMVQLLQVGMACVAVSPDARPKIGDVLRMVEEIAEKAAAREAGLKPSSEEEPTSKEESEGITPVVGRTP